MDFSRLLLLAFTAFASLATAPLFAQVQSGLVPRSDLLNQHADLTAAINSSNVERLKLAWSVPTDEEVSHTPLIHNRSVYFADWGGSVYRVDPTTGKTVWKKRVQETVKEKWPWYGFAGTGAIDERNGILFEASAEGMAYGIDMETGRVLWRTRIAQDSQAGSISKNLYYDGLFYTGLQSVEEPLSKMMPEMPINFQGKVLALDARTGRIVWERPLVAPPATGVPMWSSFAVDPETNTLFFTTGNNYNEPATELSDAIVAADAKTGEIRWARQVTQHDVWTMAQPKGPDYDFGAGPQLFEAGGRKLVGAGQKSGVFYVWDRATGEPVWSHTVGYGQVGGGIHAEGSIGADRVFLWGNNAFPYANPKEHPMDIKAVDKATGRLLWTQTKAQPALLISAGFLANDVYFVGSLDGQVRAYRASDGKKLWTSGSHGSVASSLMVDGGMLLWGSGVPGRFGGNKPYGVFAYSINTAAPRASNAPAQPQSAAWDEGAAQRRDHGAERMSKNRR